MGAELHHRHSIRLKGYDYRWAGAYFVTLCTFQRECLFTFWDCDGTLELNTLGCMAKTDWLAIPEHFPGVELDAYMVMPNHVHGILVIAQPNSAEATPPVGAQHAAPLPTPPYRHDNVTPGSLGAIVRSYKSAVTRHINQTMQTPGQTRWQRNYYEHIIHNEADLQRIRQYIWENPSHWAEDENHPDQKG
jgi:REP element-mobilizing transposase RayT